MLDLTRIRSRDKCMIKSTTVFFYGKAQGRIAHHLESKHTKLDEIKDILTLDIKTAPSAKERLKG